MLIVETTAVEVIVEGHLDLRCSLPVLGEIQQVVGMELVLVAHVEVLRGRDNCFVTETLRC